MWDVSITPEIKAELDAGAVVAIGVSGGKDSSAVAIRLVEYLDEIGHSGPRVLVHSDLGRVEWAESLPVCERLAARLKMELMVVRRNAGDLMARWETRWNNNVERYTNLSCVKVILPWSTPSMRFCTSELKTSVISASLVKRFPKQTILSVTGVRHDESACRAKMPAVQVQPKLCRKGVTGYNWNAIIGWKTEEVYAYLGEKNEPLHEAYSVYGASRVSCSYCFMASLADLQAATRCESNHPVYRNMVELEIKSSFAYQGNRWLGDVAPHLLTAESREGLIKAKANAAIRVEAEARLPKHLLYTAGWPTSIPTYDEAALLAEVRLVVARTLGLGDIGCTTPREVQDRYIELMQLAEIKNKGINKAILASMGIIQTVTQPQQLDLFATAA